MDFPKGCAVISSQYLLILSLESLSLLTLRESTVVTQWVTNVNCLLLHNFVYFFPVGGQTCVENVDNVHHIGHDHMARGRFGICPQLDFKCNARITRIRVRILPDYHSPGYPYIQVWRPSSQDENIYEKVGQVQIKESHVLVLAYVEANIPLTGLNRIPVQSGDVIGYYHPSDTGYQVRTMHTRGYELYQFRDDGITVTSVDLNNAYRRYTPRRPLMEFKLGKCIE